MKTLKTILSLIALTLCLAWTSQAQERVVVPLSHPGEPGSLELGVIRGSIEVTGYDGEEVIINYTGTDMEDEDPDSAVTKDGLRRISNNSTGFEVSENDNKVEIQGVSPLQEISFEVSVPQNFSLHLSAVNGDIRVENVTGEMEISNVNGEITLANAGGSAVANTVNGDITASFDSIHPDKPMAFSNLNGDIDVTLPANAKVSAKMKSEFGDVYTDFDMNISQDDQDGVDISMGSGTYEISINNWMYGTINGGGPEYLFRSLRGDIYIRKQ